MSPYTYTLCDSFNLILIYWLINMSYHILFYSRSAIFTLLSKDCDWWLSRPHDLWRRWILITCNKRNSLKLKCNTCWLILWFHVLYQQYFSHTSTMEMLLWNYNAALLRLTKDLARSWIRTSFSITQSRKRSLLDHLQNAIFWHLITKHGCLH